MIKEMTIKITDNTICGVNPKESVCHGDSGGPMITLSKNGTYQQIGIMSFALQSTNLTDPRQSKVKHGCPLEAPNVFSRETAQLDCEPASLTGNGI